MTAEGCGRTFLAVLAACAAFAAVKVAAALAVDVTPAPVATEFLGWVGAGAGFALVFGLIAPGKRWGTGLPLLLFLELAGGAALALWMAMGDYAAPPGLFSGAAAGCVVGLLILALLRRQAAWNTRKWVAGLVPGALAAAWLGSWLVASHDLARVRREVLPALEAFVAAEVLAETGPVEWTGPATRVWRSGKAHILADGPMQGKRVHLRLDAPGPLAGSPGHLDGLTVSGLEVKLLQERGLEAGENVESVLRGRLRASGVKPELIAALQWRQSRFSSDYHLQGTRHGVTYTLEPNGYSDIGEHFSLRCTGVYSPSAP